MSELDPKLSECYREVATETPSPALDAAILAAARQHVARPKRRERSAWSQWMVPASVMATLVLGVSITLMMEREYPETAMPQSMERDRAVAGGASAPAPAQDKVADAPAGPVAASKADALPAKRLEPTLRKEMPAAAAAEAFSPPMPATPTVSGSVQRPDAVPFKTEEKAKPAPADLGRSEPVEADARPQRLRARVAEPGVLRESNRAADAAVRSVGAAAPAKEGGNKLLATPRSPEGWIKDIRRLKREGRDKEAAEQLAELRRAYPALLIPEDLGK